MKSKLKDNGGGHFELTIDRSEWGPRETQDRDGPEGRLYDEHGRSCCLGLLCRAAVVMTGAEDPADNLRGLAMPNSVIAENIERDVPASVRPMLLELKTVTERGAPKSRYYVNTDFAYQAALTNDEEKPDLATREAHIQGLFAARANILVLFEGELFPGGKGPDER